MRISIGILAWNEEPSIGLTIASLARQSLLLAPAGDSVEILIVPNGCGDDTAGAARRALDAVAWPPGISWRVDELATPGKTNAWNVYVHELSDPAAEVLILADADILFHGDDTLRSMVGVLSNNPHALVATDLPVKDIALRPDKSPAVRLSLAVAGMTAASPGQLTGQLYAARATALRRLRMPAGLLIDDGFIKQMLCTDFLRQPVDHTRIVRAPDAAHVFEAYVKPSDVIPNQRRQVVGHAIYTFLRDAMKDAIGRGEDPEAWLHRQCTDAPDWFRRLVQARVRDGGPWVMPKGMMTARWKRWKNLRGARRWSALPAAAAGSLVDAVVLIWANHTLKAGRLKGIWKDTTSAKLGRVG